MKNIKRFMSIITVAVMVFCLNAFTVSAETFSITVNNTNTDSVSINGKTFTAYKVFSVLYNEGADAYTYSADTTCISSDYSSALSDFGASNVNDLITAIDSEANARKFADSVYNNYVKNNNMNAGVVKASAEASSEQAVITVTEAGYYLVFGEGTNNDGADTKDTVTSLVMLDTVAPSVEINAKLDAPKLTKQIQHNDDNSWGNVGDNQVGDTVHYRFISEIPENAVSFDSYNYIIHDTMSAGLDFVDDSVKVYIGEGTSNQLDASYITVNETDSQNFTVSIDVLKALNDKKITVNDTIYTYYDAVLNKSALIAEDHPDSTNHNDNTAYLEYSNNPYDNDSTGETVRSEVYDWTFSFQVNKIDSSVPGKPLENAVFNIKKGEDVLKFTLKEANVYIVDSLGSITDITTDGSGTFKIIGLDDEIDYTLVEKTAPPGYNKAENVVFKLSSGYNTNGNQLDSLSATIDGTPGKNNSVDVVNQSGSKLVGTGGIGTTIFYVSGGVLMAVAVVLLITKKKMRNK